MNFIVENYPLTSTVFFINGDFKSVSNGFINFINQVKDGKDELLVENDERTIKDSLEMLYPITTAEERRYLIICFSNQWSIYVSNHFNGTDLSCPNVVCQNLKSSYIRIGFDNYKSDFFEYIRFINGYEKIRQIGYYEDDKKFYNEGNLFPIEDPGIFLTRNRTVKINIDVKLRLLSYLGIHLTEDNIESPKKITLISKRGPKYPATKEYNKMEYLKIFQNP